MDARLLGLITVAGLAPAELSGAWTTKSEPGPLPGISESCKRQPVFQDYTTRCPSCADVEILSCELLLGSREGENILRFTLLNHNEVFTRHSDSVRFGHIGINPVAGAAVNPFDVSGGAAGIGRNESPEEFQRDYPAYRPDNAMSESVPNPISIAPRETRSFEVNGITDFPPISECGDLVFLAIVLRGQLEEPHLWNRNYACTIQPCNRQDFRACTVRRGDPGKGKASPGNGKN